MVVETISGIIDIRDYEAMEALVVKQFNDAGLPAIKMFDDGETSHYLYVFLQRTDASDAPAPPSEPESVTGMPQHLAGMQPGYLRGSSLQNSTLMMARNAWEGSNVDQSKPSAGELAVLFAVFDRQAIDALAIDAPAPEPQLDGMFITDLQGELLTAEELSEISRITAQRIIEAQEDPEAMIAATQKKEAAQISNARVKADPFGVLGGDDELSESAPEDPSEPLPSLDDAES